MNKYIAVIISFALFVLPFCAGAETVDVVSLSIGDGPNDAGVSSPEKAVSDFTVPTAFAISPDGSLYLLDAPKFCVKVFSPNGKFLRSIPYPAKTDDGSPILGIDLAIGADGALFLANATQGLIWKFDTAGKLVATFGKSADKAGMVELLQQVAVGSKGDLFAGDGMSSGILHIASDGRKIEMLPGAFFPPVVAPDGSLVMVKMITGSKRAYISLCPADQSTIQQFTALVMEKPILNAAAIGFDARNHLYMFVVYGESDDNSEGAYVNEFNEAGITVRRVAVPESPGVGMNRYLGVTPDGRILMAASDEKVFRIVEYR